MPVLIKKLATSRLNAVDYSQLLTRFQDDVEKSGIRLNSDETLNSLFTTFKQKLEQFKRSLVQVPTNHNTRALAEADRQRDNDFSALRLSIRPYRTSKREGEADAYTRLNKLFSDNKDAPSKGYESQTAHINNLLSKLATSPYKEAVALLALRRFVDNLAESNRQFDLLFAGRSKEQLNKVSYDSKLLRAEVYDSYNLICDYVSVMVRAKNTKLYKDLIPVINSSRNYYAEVISRRNKAKKESN